MVCTSRTRVCWQLRTAILLVCCRRLFGFNLPRAASSGLAAATAEQPFSLIVLKVCKKEPERRAIHGPA